MGVVTTYVCDVSGVSSTNKDEFVELSIGVHATGDNRHRVYGQNYLYVHQDMAIKLGLLGVKKDEVAPPEPTIEEKLTTLLKEFISDVAQDVVDNQ